MKLNPSQVAALDQAGASIVPLLNKFVTIAIDELDVKYTETQMVARFFKHMLEEEEFAYAAALFAFAIVEWAKERKVTHGRNVRS